MKTKNSQNFSKKVRKFKDIKMIVVHYTGMQSKIESIKRLLDPRYKVSCHYLIDRKGQLIKMVDENRTAWHAGKSKWKNFNNLNKNSIGIELVNKGHNFGYEKFTNLQIKRLIDLCLKLKRKYKIKNSNIVGHSDIAPLRKIDPGEKFPWEYLSKKKIGFWPSFSKLKLSEFKLSSIETDFFKNIYKVGYRYFDLKKRSKRDKEVIIAFQRRFLNNNVTGFIDQKTYIISHLLTRNYKN